MLEAMMAVSQALRIDSAIPVRGAKPGSKLKSLITLANLWRTWVNAHVLGKAGVAPGTDATNFKITNTFDFQLNGKIYRKAAADDIAAPGVNTTASQFRKVLLSIQADGTVIRTAGAVTTVSQAAALLPAVPADTVPFGWIELPNSFTSGATSVTGGMCFDGFNNGAYGTAVVELT